MEGDTIALALVFVGFILTILLVIWNVSNRICDKIGNVVIILDTKFDIIIDKLGKISTDILVMKELSRSHQTVNFTLDESGLTGTIELRTEDFTETSLTYTIIFSQNIRKDIAEISLREINKRNLVTLGHSGSVIVLIINSRDLNENASIVENYLKVLDKKLGFDNSNEIIQFIEDKLRERLKR